MPGTIDARLDELGITLPESSPPTANYVNWRVAGNMLYLAGNNPLDLDGNLKTGKLGRDMTTRDGYEAARLVGLNLLAAARAALGGNLDRVVRVVKVYGMVNAMPHFAEHPGVVNGCSDLFVEVFGEDRGGHARSAIGMESLPFGMCVEIEAVFEIER